MQPVGRTSAYILAVSLFSAAVWYTLIAQDITVRAPAPTEPGQPFASVVDDFFNYLVPTLMQERLVILLGLLAFGALIVLGLELRSLTTPAPGTLVTLGLGVGSVLWIVANLIQLGGHRAIEVMIQNGRDPQVVHPVFIVVEFVDDWLEIAGYLLIGLAMVTLGVSANTRVPQAWRRASIAIGAVIVVLSVVLAFELAGLADLLLFAVGVVLLPAWAIWTAALTTEPRIGETRSVS